jgi:hypothetical protein
VRLVDAPGELCGVELEVLGWRTEQGEVALRCRLIDGSVGTIPARWTDLPRASPAECRLGVLASPAGWRLVCERLKALRERRPVPGAAPVENGGADVGTARAGVGRAGGGGGGGVGDVPPWLQIEATLRRARLLARLVEAERDE